MFDRPFSEMQAGDYWESVPRGVVASDRQLFAGWSGDHYPLHLDVGYAAATRYRLPILPGLAVLSLPFGLVPLQAPQVIAFYGLHRLRFINPVYNGDVITFSVRSLQTEIQAISGLVTAQLEALLSGGTLAMIAEILMLMQVGG